MASSEVSISQLPVVNSINKGDFLIVQTPNATNRLDFENFVVGLDNTSFSSTIEQHTTDINGLSGVLYATPSSESIHQADYYVPITIAGTTYKIMLKQA